MPAAADFNGSVNQSLYFARLLAEQADALEAGVGDVLFYRQQQQCYCEAALDALYRALHFLILGELSEAGVAVSSVAREPGDLLAELDSAARLHPTPVLNQLRANLQGGKSLRRMLASWQQLWVLRHARAASTEILSADSGLKTSEIHAWRQELAELFEYSREQGREY